MSLIVLISAFYVYIHRIYTYITGFIMKRKKIPITQSRRNLNDIENEKAKISEQKFKQRLKHPAIIEIRGKGLMLALILESNELAKKLVIKSLEKGLILFWLLYESRAVRITPPLNITDKEIKISTDIILKTLDEIYN